ncbi:MAG: hypothetical protein SCH71_14115 [Desulfobulbaceae bacterium]|nr:hypothetical protein [Desulfobulbaceae bacterium]
MSGKADSRFPLSIAGAQIKKPERIIAPAFPVGASPDYGSSPSLFAFIEEACETPNSEECGVNRRTYGKPQ